MGNKVNIINSIKRGFTNSLLTMYSYIDSSIDLTEVISGRSKVDLPLGSETTFIFQVDISGSFYDAVNPDDDDYLLYRYVVRTKVDGTQTFHRIDNYDNTTGAITINTAFGEAITTADSLEIVVLDSVFIDTMFEDVIVGAKGFRKNTFNLELVLKTKQDSKKEKMRNFIDVIQEMIADSSYIIQIYKADGITPNGYIKFENEGRFTDITDLGEQIIVYRGTFPIYYYVNYGG